MNEKEPFDTIMPTLENMTDYFSKEFYRVIHDVGGILVQIEASETPTRSYVVNLTEQEGNEERNRDTEKKIRADVMDDYEKKIKRNRPDDSDPCDEPHE